MGKKILIVDDEKDVLDVLEKRLSDAGYEVIQADNGNDAMIMAKSHHPDLILLDIIMPDMDGSAIAEVLENDPSTKNIPVMFLTCLLTKEEEKGGHLRGGKYFVAKPYEPKELLDAVGKYLEA